MIRTVLRTALAAVLFTLPAPAILAASFDCAGASTPFERAICDNPELSAADERLDRSWATAIGGLSKQALKELQAGQRQWLDYARRACTRTAEPLEEGAYDERGVSCLVELFDSRSGMLEASRMLEGTRFYPLARHAAWPDPNETDNPQSYWPVAHYEMSVAQIDADTEVARRFNALVLAQGEQLSGLVEPGQGPFGNEDDSSDLTVSILPEELAGTGRISLRTETYWYGHGAAHGNWTVSYLHYLTGESRWMEAGDLFAGEGWQQALLDLAVSALRQQHGDMLMLDDTTFIADSVADPTRWSLSDSYALIVQFQPYEVAAYAYGAPTARISWEALEPYLADTADLVRYGY